MADVYDTMLFEQQTPYLQWLKKHENTSVSRGGSVRVIHFLSCGDTVDLKNIFDDEDCEYVLFLGRDGIVDDFASGCVQDYFKEHTNVDILYADEDYLDKHRCNPWFKPDYSPDTLLSFFYFGKVFAVKKILLEKVYDVYATIYEMVLHAVELSRKVAHLDKVLYTNESLWYENILDGAEEKYDEIKSKAIKRRKYAMGSQEMISVIIPSKDNCEMLKRCLDTFIKNTKYSQYEFIVVDNGSSNDQKMCITDMISEMTQVSGKRIEYIYENKGYFNFSEMCNIGVRHSFGDYYLFLNDDIEVVNEDWLDRMFSLAVRPHVGAVGAKLLYPSDTENHNIQHVGITNMGIGPAHKLAGLEDTDILYHGHNCLNYNMLAVTAACLLVSREKYNRVRGFDEELAVAYNDVDFCFKLHEAAYYNVQCNEAVLIHHESVSRGHDISDEKVARLESEKSLLYKKHPNLIANDPFYSRHLVQWKKDVEYNCNYTYEYEKAVEPDKVSREESHKLPKEHTNKYVKKLTGESRIMFQIDSMNIVNDTMSVKGWYVVQGLDNGDSENILLSRKLLLKNMDNGRIYKCDIQPVYRPDVEALFVADGKPVNGTKRTALSGIDMNIDMSNMLEGRYRVGVLLKSKIIWNKDVEESYGTESME